jgi:single-stranded-DNA-specific exonuclease
MDARISASIGLNTGLDETMEPDARAVDAAGSGPGQVAANESGTLLKRIAAESTTWRLADELPISTLDAVPPYTRLQVQLLHNRGVDGSERIQAFLAADWRSLRVDVPAMRRATERLRAGIARAERIVVYGDHDADGMTSCAVVLLALRALGARAEPYIPRRDDDGRGLNAQAVRALATDGASLIITTDCGTVNVEEVELARSLGVDVIVTDHHPPHGSLADAYAIVNPRVDEDASFDVNLAGAGVAFRLAQTLLDDERTDVLMRLLDLVAIGTIGDVVPLVPQNWALAHAGLQQLNEAPRPGIRALLRLAGMTAGEVTERDIGYVIAPRLNAAPRMGDPLIALRLLLTEDDEEADQLAAELDRLNTSRQTQLEAILVEAREQAWVQMSDDQAGTAPASDMLLVVGDGWPLGLTGLVAGRLADEFGVPSFAVSRDGAEARGSGRTPEGVNLVAALAANAELLRRFGGHARAAGFTVDSDNLETLAVRLRVQLAEQRSGRERHGEAAYVADGDAAIMVDCRLPLNRIKHETYESMRALAPFGPQFPEPHFVCRDAQILRCWRSGPGGRNLRLSLRDNSGTRVALWSRHGDWSEAIQAELGHLPRFDVVYTLSAYRPPSGELELIPRIVALAPVGNAG